MREKYSEITTRITGWFIYFWNMDIQKFYKLFLKCNKVTLDSRKIEQGDVFFAFSGENFNAATLAADAIAKGALAVIVEQEAYANPEENIFYVESTLAFLQNLATLHRSQLKIPIIGLTGSNGKTTTKELISAVLEQKYRVQYTFGNLNNHIGVPLTLLSIKPEHEIAVVEMGANHQKEIKELCEIAQPDLGYITNFGKAHLAGFGGFEGVIKGKSELYDYLKNHGKTILVNETDAIQAEKTNDYDNKITFGQVNSEFFFKGFNENNFVGLIHNGEKALSKLTGDYNFTNLCAAASLGFHFGLDFSQIKTAIEQYSPTNMRSQIMQKNGKTLVLDTYNANPSSMAASLKNFHGFQGSKAVIIGDMLELGEESAAEHSHIMNLVKDYNFDEVMTVGKHFSEANSGTAFPDAAALIEHLKSQKIRSENVLLKGSRGIALEKIIEFI